METLTLQAEQLHFLSSQEERLQAESTAKVKLYSSIIHANKQQCKLAYLSFHNQHKYCPVVNSTTVDYSAFWRNCICGRQSLQAYKQAAYYNLKTFGLYWELVDAKVIQPHDFAVPDISNDDINITFPAFESVLPYEFLYINVDAGVGKSNKIIAGQLPPAPNIDVLVISWASNENTLPATE
jgi:hypothetical protein